MSTPSAEIGRRLKQARVRAGCSQADVATELDVTQTAVSYWEAGRRLPGIDQLMRLAEFLDAPLSELLPDESVRRPVGAILRAVGEQVDDHVLAQALEAFTQQAADQPAPAVTLTVKAASARDAAEQLIAAAGLDEEKAVDVDDLANRCGARVLDFDFGTLVDGLVVQLNDGPAIGLHTDQSNAGRRRFTLAHELGHHLLRHTASFHVDFADAGDTAGSAPGYNWQHERAANDFAANLLMPAAWVRHAARHPIELDELAQRFEVSRAAMGFRLASLGLRQGPLE
jgi:Zn-dependent peptidase ImmA (M78 family)/transcriptional regulator with XRE-family HTH domain